jgi:hypothetical protein
VRTWALLPVASADPTLKEVEKALEKAVEQLAERIAAWAGLTAVAGS